MDSNAHRMSHAHEPSGSRISMIHTFVLLAVAVVFRCWQIDHVPGVNGDEAWMGVQSLRFLDGKPVRWFTPTGNPMNLFHFGPMVLLHSVWLPSVTLLRTTVLLSGLLVLPVNFFMCRRVLGLRIATISTMILAVLPINIAYSRFAWDASQSLLFTLPPIYCALLVVAEPKRRTRWLVLAGLSLVAALIVHPTNVFIVPIVAMASLSFLKKPGFLKASRGVSGKSGSAPVVTQRGSYKSRASRTLHQLAWIGSGLIVVAVTFLGATRIEVAARRLVSIEQWGLFCRYYVDLFSGTTPLRYIAGTQADGSSADVMLYRLAAVMFLGFAGFGLIRCLREGATPTVRCFTLGAAASALGFFLVAGPSAMAPGYERYAICLVGPGAILLSLGVDWWMDRHRRLATISSAAVAWLLLIAFYVHYFQTIDATGGEAHLTFRTASVEPKAAVCATMLREALPGESLTVVAPEWWNYWPVAYLAHRMEQVRVVASEAGDPPLGPLQGLDRPIPFLHAVCESPGEVPVCFVAFEGSETVETVRRCMTEAGVVYSTTTILDAACRPVLTVVWPVGKASVDAIGDRRPGLPVRQSFSGLFDPKN